MNAAVLDDDAEAEETDFGVESTTPPSTWVLLRLGRFARPYRWQLLLGFVLTLAATAASLVPPYLTMPLVDRVLIPRQAGEPVPFSMVWWYLGGLVAAALVAFIVLVFATTVLRLQQNQAAERALATAVETSQP